MASRTRSSSQVRPDAALVRPTSARTVGSGLRVVYGGVRHARSERGEGVVAPIVRIDTRATKHERPAVLVKLVPAAFKLLV
jgi:hypothetical protein